MTTTRRILLLLCLLIVGSLLLPATSAFAENPSDFALTAITGPQKGKEFKLSQAKGHYVALHFLLKTECPYCIKHTRTYLENADRVAGVDHIFIKPDGEEEIAQWAGKFDPKSLPTVYRDVDAKLADQFAIPNGYSFHKQTVHFPALVLLDTNGREVFRYVGKSNTDRYSFDDFAAKMEELTGKDAANCNVDANKLAIKGYDPVAYQASNSATKGDPKIESSYRGAKYHFASEANRTLFAKNPEKYVPAYGGFCAAGVGHGVRKDVDPTNFKVTNGRTFLFYKGAEGDGKEYWLKDEAAETKKADAEWTTKNAK